jgi:hypothetical protein
MDQPRLSFFTFYFLIFACFENCQNWSMNELINRLTSAGLTEQQAIQAITIVKDFAKEKFPIFGGAIDRLFDKYKVKRDDDFLE